MKQVIYISRVAYSAAAQYASHHRACPTAIAGSLQTEPLDQPDGSCLCRLLPAIVILEGDSE